MGGRLDWQAAYARLEQARRALDAAAKRAPEEVQRILDDRARALAKPPAARTPVAAAAVLVFTLGDERYGVDPKHVLEVVPCRELTLLPAAPPPLAGVINHRGRILAALDLRPLLGLAGSRPAETARIVVAEAGGMAFGILADAVPGMVPLDPGGARPSPVGPGSTPPAFVKSVTRDMVGVLDLDALARDPRILIDEAAG